MIQDEIFGLVITVQRFGIKHVLSNIG